MWSADKYWQLNSWDGTLIPKPFSRIVFQYCDEFIHIPPKATHEECENYRQELDNTLNRMMAKTDNHYNPKPAKPEPN